MWDEKKREEERRREEKREEEKRSEMKREGSKKGFLGIMKSNCPLFGRSQGQSVVISCKEKGK